MVMLVFDVFWVFGSMHIFGESVMIRVAKGGGAGLPMLLKVPPVYWPGFGAHPE